jgi:hypothetical protein
VWAEDGTEGSGPRLRGFGVVRPCREGRTLGPLFADDAEIADALFVRLTAGSSEVFLDTPEANLAAVALARRNGMSPVVETARMYRGDPGLPSGHIFGVSTFELADAHMGDSDFRIPGTRD